MDFCAESGREVGSQLLVKLHADNLLSHDKLWDGLKQVIITMRFEYTYSQFLIICIANITVFCSTL